MLPVVSSPGAAVPPLSVPQAPAVAEREPPLGASAYTGPGTSTNTSRHTSPLPMFEDQLAELSLQIRQLMTEHAQYEHLRHGLPGDPALSQTPHSTPAPTPSRSPFLDPEPDAGGRGGPRCRLRLDFQPEPRQPSPQPKADGKARPPGAGPEAGLEAKQSPSPGAGPRRSPEGDAEAGPLTSLRPQGKAATKAVLRCPPSIPPSPPFHLWARWKGGGGGGSGGWHCVGTALCWEG